MYHNVLTHAEFHSRKFKRAACIALATLALYAAAPLMLFANQELDEGDAKLNPLAWQTDLAIWTAVVFLILLAILWIFAFGPIVKALDMREKSEMDKINAINKANSDAKELLLQYQTQISGAQEEAANILADARAAADRQKDDIIAQARDAAAQERERAKAEIQSATDAALQEIAQKSAELATDLAGKIIKRDIDKKLDDDVIRDAVEKIANS